MKITRAQELIAASRIVRAQRAITAARPYVAKMAEVVRHLAGTPDAARHPLFRPGEPGGRSAVIAIAADRGFAGAYNSSVIRAAERLARTQREAGSEVDLMAVGRKVESYFRYRGEPLAFSLTGMSDRPGFDDARRVAAAVMEPFAAGEVSQVHMVYTRFMSIGSQAVTVRQLVPLQPDEDHPAGEERDVAGFKTDYEFEPDPAEILDRLLPAWVEAEVLAAMLEAAASEQAARQRAMKAATDNADELITTLRRIMNRARQDAITTEIMEIVGGSEALRQARQAGGAGTHHETFEPAAEPA